MPVDVRDVGEIEQATCSSGLLMAQRVILWRRANSVAIGDEADSSRI
jgi:hypothetical protein